MLDPQSWLPQAQELTLGQRRRVDHDCGTGRTMVVAATPEGWNAYCWRCSDKGFKPAPTPSLAERIARLKEKEAVDDDARRTLAPPLPADFNPSDWPLYARVWLYRAGLSNDSINAAGLYYNGRLDRVVLPVFQMGKLVYWQARGFDKGRAKYINPSVDKSKLAARFGSGDTLVLTEDFLSAVRVGEVTEAWSILGTALSDALAADIAAAKKPVAIWLDPDGAGRKARGKILRTLSLLGVDARIIRTDTDPKLYSLEEITNHVGSRV